MKHIYFLILFFSFYNIKAQKYDNVWPIGYSSCQGCPVSAIDFTYGRPDSAALYTPIKTYYTNAAISDSNGLFQFWTSGIQVANKYGQILDNSIDFNLDSSVVNGGWTYYIPLFQCAIALPFPEHPGQYYLFHLSGKDWGNLTYLQPPRMAYSTIDMNANGGAGRMNLKNQTAINDTLLYSTMQAVKHGNGRDWWIVAHEFNTNGLYSILLTKDSLSTIVKSHAGPLIRKGIVCGQSNFSPDGSKFAIASRDSSLLYLYRFDRCTGIFSFDTLIRHAYNSTGRNLTSCAFSPNSRYLYSSDYDHVFQYDTDDPDIISTEKIIATINGSPNQFFRFANAPDGKIYENAWGSSPYYHVINDPDAADTACHFVAEQLKVMNQGRTFPDFPNFRLGSLPASSCDSLTNNIRSVLNSKEVIVSPNPSSGQFHFIISDSDQIDKIIITDISGRTILSNKLKSDIDLSVFNEGIYFYNLFSIEGKLWKGTLVIMKK